MSETWLRERRFYAPGEVPPNATVIDDPAKVSEVRRALLMERAMVEEYGPTPERTVLASVSTGEVEVCGRKLRMARVGFFAPDRVPPDADVIDIATTIGRWRNFYAIVREYQDKYGPSDERTVLAEVPL